MVTSVQPNFGDFYQLVGLSTDEKPTDVGINSLFLALDTNEMFYFDGEDWVAVGGDSGDEK